MVNNKRLYQDVVTGLCPMLSCTTMPGHHNTIFDINTLNAGIINAAIQDSSVGGCANARKSLGGRKEPSDRWFASMLKSPVVAEVQNVFDMQVTQQFKKMVRLGMVPKEGLTIAIDMHLIPRYDKKPGKELTRSRYKNGTKLFERYMTAQCVDKSLKIHLGAQYLEMGDSVPDFVDRILKSVKKTGAKIRLVLLDREFFSVDTIIALLNNNVTYLMPCRNSSGVIAALREYDKNTRNATSQATLQGHTGMVDFTMRIEKRKNNKDATMPEQKFIGFATNAPTIDVKKYTKRWGVETGYRLVETMRAKTRIQDMAARMLCFYYSLLAYNEWMIVRVMLSDGTERQSAMTQLTFQSCCIQAVLPDPEQPP